MTQVGKTGSAPPVAVVPGGRMVPGARGVTSTHRPEVEGISPQAGVSFDDAAFGDDDDAPPGEEDKAGGADAPLVFTTTTQAFAAMFDVSAPAKGAQSHVSAGLRSRAIETYESNTKVVSGAGPGRGRSFRMTL
ncbi:MAG: hypothetical protein IIC54_12835 [Proteobacteria bacterium]|nr:hypothetical protein [Pseudomonadota bacterium]